ncbi:MAG TPA: Gfo/Idh/MocA family oxidoreductase, partial [Candidatus Eisenbacteria bacterium]|nr:Gfo/Idh/MocA family oxidoreductase [Candidatus Eisenbacteria bacterium]
SGPIALVLSYEGTEDAARNAQESHGSPAPRLHGEAGDLIPPRASHAARPPVVSLVGAGNFATAHLLPALRAVSGVEFAQVVASRGLNAETVRRRWKFRGAGTDPVSVWGDAATQVAIIATRHDTHARFARQAIEAGKAVFVEKPLALNEDELQEVGEALRRTGGRLMVGFNRRFAPSVRWILDQFGPDRSEMRLHFRVAAGPLSSDHWLLDPEIGGGRLLGEGCHFIDLACFAAGVEPSQIQATSLDATSRRGGPHDFLLSLRFANGATATIEYLSSSNARVAKEYLEFHRAGMSAILRDYLEAEVYRGGRTQRRKWKTRDKGHRAEIAEFMAAVKGGLPTPIPEHESIRSTQLTLMAMRSIGEGRPIDVPNR